MTFGEILVKKSEKYKWKSCVQNLASKESDILYDHEKRWFNYNRNNKRPIETKKGQLSLRKWEFLFIAISVVKISYWCDA